MQEREEFARCADRLRCFTDGHRCLIVSELFRGERTVGVLASLCGVDISTASHHLGILYRAEIVIRRRSGRKVFYSLHPGVKRYRDGQLLEVIDLGCCVLNFEPDSVPPAADMRPD